MDAAPAANAEPAFPAVLVNAGCDNWHPVVISTRTSSNKPMPQVLHIIIVTPTWYPQGTIHFKEDVLRVKRSRFRSVILSAAKDLCPARDPKLALRACARREAKG